MKERDTKTPFSEKAPPTPESVELLYEVVEEKLEEISEAHQAEDIHHGWLVSADGLWWFRVMDYPNRDHKIAGIKKMEVPQEDQESFLEYNYRILRENDRLNVDKAVLEKVINKTETDDEPQRVGEITRSTLLTEILGDSTSRTISTEEADKLTMQLKNSRPYGE